MEDEFGERSDSGESFNPYADLTMQLVDGLVRVPLNIWSTENGTLAELSRKVRAACVGRCAPEFLKGREISFQMLAREAFRQPVPTANPLIVDRHDQLHLLVRQLLNAMCVVNFCHATLIGQMEYAAVSAAAGAAAGAAGAVAVLNSWGPNIRRINGKLAGLRKAIEELVIVTFFQAWPIMSRLGWYGIGSGAARTCSFLGHFLEFPVRLSSKRSDLFWLNPAMPPFCRVLDELS